MSRRWFEALFAPKGVAVVGSCSNPSKLAWGTLQAVLRGVEMPSSRRAVVAIDRHAVSPEMLSHAALPFQYSNALEVPLDVASFIEQAVLVTPRDSTLQRMRECMQAFPSLQVINVVSGGFREASNEQLETQLIQEAHSHDIRLLGPNSVGVIDAHSQYSSMFLRIFPQPGGLSLISQSGGVCGAAVELTCRNPNLGFHRVVSLGNAADVGFVETLQGMGEDPGTQVILLYLEGLGQTDVGDDFVETARAVSKEKPIIALKAGTTSAGSRAVSSHTGTLAGNDRIYGAGLRSAGIVQAPSLQSMLNMAHALSCHPRVPFVSSGMDAPLERWYRTAVVSNAGGPAALTVDKLESTEAAIVPALSETVQQRIHGGMDIHPLCATANPVDLLGGATSESYLSALRALTDAENIDAVVALHVPTALSDPMDLANALVSMTCDSSKPLVSMMVSEDHNFMDSAFSIMHSAGIPTFCHAEAVADAFHAWKEREDRYPSDAENKECVALSDSQLAQGSDYLSQFNSQSWIREHEARPLLDIVGIEQPRAELVHFSSGDGVLAAANRIGYPIVLKRVDNVHKSDTGGVAVNLQNSVQVRKALCKMLSGRHDSKATPMLVCEYISEHSNLYHIREFFVGFTRDKIFGPVVCFGSGGTLVEALDDVAFALPPRSRRDTLKLLNEPKLASRRITSGIRSEAPLDLSIIAAVVELCSSISRAFPRIAELDINPLLVGVSEDGTTRALAADVKFRLD